MTKAKLVALIAAGALLSGAGAACAQTTAAPAPPAYGAAIGLDQAKKAAAAAEAEARKNGWPMAIVVVDSGGNLVLLERMDNTQLGSIEVARQKAYTAAAFRRPTKVFQDLIAQGGANLRLLTLGGASLIEGGIPIMADGKVIGAIGVSGGTSQQDAQVAQAGVDALK
jgi:uncharacterized protein GlcG (DUF336 family)